MAGLDDFNFKKDSWQLKRCCQSIDEQRGGMQGQEVISLDVLDHFTSQYLVVISIQNFHRKVSTCTNSVYMYQAL